jgi:transcriptional regulator
VAAGDDPLRHVLALENVRRALDLIEEAQRTLGRAAEELSPIQFGSPAQDRIMKLYDKVHSEWYRTRRLLDDKRIQIDRELTEAERKSFTEVG